MEEDTVTEGYVKLEYPLSDVTVRIIAGLLLNFGAPKLEIRRLAN